MAVEEPVGLLLAGDESDVRPSAARFMAQDVDMQLPCPHAFEPQTQQTTLARAFSVTGPGTYSGKQARTLNFEPCTAEGWWIDRTDLPEQLPIRVSVRNVWTTVRSIVLRSGNPHNYLRMAEHIIALRLGMGLDNVLIRIESGDPPLFNVGSLDIVEGVEGVGLVEQADRPLTYWAVKEPVTIGGRNGSFLSLWPPEDGSKMLQVDCAVDFPTAIGKQRIQFDLSAEAFRHGAHARTNCSRTTMMYVKTIGRLFADTRSLGYSPDNILIAGKHRYFNEPKLLHEDKSLEAVWHRSCLDLIAALSLVETGRLAGRVFSYKAGHDLDVRLVAHLYLRDLLTPV